MESKWSEIIFSAIFGGFFVAMLQYFILRRELKLKYIHNSRDISQNLQSKYLIFKNTIQDYIEKKETKNFNLLTSHAEELFNSMTDICEAILDDTLTKNGRKRYIPIIKEVIEMDLIKYYYKITSLEYKEQQYKLILEVYRKYCTK